MLRRMREVGGELPSDRKLRYKLLEMFPTDQNPVEMNQHKVSREPWVSLLTMAHPPKHLGFQVMTIWMTSSQRLNGAIYMTTKRDYCVMDVTLA